MSFRKRKPFLSINTLTLLFFLPAWLFGSASWAMGLEGTWQGSLDVGLVKFRVALVIKEDPQGNLSVLFNNIDDGLYNVPVTILHATDHSLKGQTLYGQILSLKSRPKYHYLIGTYHQTHGNFEKPGASSSITLYPGTDYLFPRLDAENQPVTAYTYQPPSKQEGRESASLPARGIPLIELGVRKILDGTFPHIHGIVVVQNDKRLVDETFYGYKDEDTHPVQSITKSIFSLLFGIGQDQKLFQTNQRLYDFFPAYRSRKDWDPQKDQITLEHLLTMSSGLDCSDWKNAQDCSWGMVRSDDWADYTLSKPLARRPGSQFAYCGACLLPLSVILEKASGMNVPDFAQKYLFDPLEIHSAQLVKAPSAGTTVVPVSFGLSLSPLDLAKIGLLILHKGKWNGQQVVSEDWIDRSTSAHVDKDQTNKKYDYGYLWWKTEMPAETKKIQVLMGWGVGGNYLFIVPDKELVCVVTGGNYNDAKAARGSLELFQNYVLPAF